MKLKLLAISFRRCSLECLSFLSAEAFAARMGLGIGMRNQSLAGVRARAGVRSATPAPLASGLSATRMYFLKIFKILQVSPQAERHLLGLAKTDAPSRRAQRATIDCGMGHFAERKHFL